MSDMSTDTHFLSRKLHFTVSLAALALGLLVAGCGKQTRPQTVSEEEAKELYNRANLFVSKIGETEFPSIDQRWVSIGATQLQQGFMAVIRGIAQPSTF